MVDAKPRQDVVPEDRKSIMRFKALDNRKAVSNADALLALFVKVHGQWRFEGMASTYQELLPEGDRYIIADNGPNSYHIATLPSGNDPMPDVDTMASDTALAALRRKLEGNR